jgi:lanosterol synthase
MYENIAIPFIRKKALDRVHQLIVYEDDNTHSQCIAPISKALHMVCRFITDGPDSAAFKQHVAKIDDFLWMSNEGMMMTGTNGSQLWDLAFISQAIAEGGLAEQKENRESCTRALDWLDKAQIRKNPKWYKEAYRHGSRGAWPFSTPEQSYTVSPEGTRQVTNR